MITIATRLNSVEEYYFSRKLREVRQLISEGKPIINMGIGSPDLAPHSSVITAINKAMFDEKAHEYQSYQGLPELRQEMANFYKKQFGVSSDKELEFLPLLGSKEGIMHISMAFLNAGDEVLIPNPGYPTYSSAVKIAGATPLYYDLNEGNNYHPDFKNISQLIKEFEGRAEGNRVSGMFINYPHMPTGQLPETEIFEQLISFAKQQDIIIIHDNPYSFILNENPVSILSVAGAKEVVIELNSLSKSHNMAGWRVGMLCASKIRIDEVLRFKSNMDSGMFLPIQLAAAKALELDESWHQQLNEVYKNRREKVFELLHLLNCRFDTSQAGMFVWAAVPDSCKDGYALSDEVLYQSNVFITPGGIFGSNGDKYVRVSLCATEEKIVESINRIKHTK